jgi:hypothetical protein
MSCTLANVPADLRSICHVSRAGQHTRTRADTRSLIKTNISNQGFEALAIGSGSRTAEAPQLITCALALAVRERLAANRAVHTVVTWYLFGSAATGLLYDTEGARIG